MRYTRLQNICLFGIGLFLQPWFSHATESSLMQARVTFIQALHEQDGALNRATEQFSILARNNTDNPVYQAYLGACKTLEARDAWMPWNKMHYSEEGLDM